MIMALKIKVGRKSFASPGGCLDKHFAHLHWRSNIEFRNATTGDNNQNKNMRFWFKLGKAQREILGILFQVDEIMPVSKKHVYK